MTEFFKSVVFSELPNSPSKLTFLNLKFLNCLMTIGMVSSLWYCWRSEAISKSNLKSEKNVRVVNFHIYIYVVNALLSSFQILINQFTGGHGERYWFGRTTNSYVIHTCIEWQEKYKEKFKKKRKKKNATVAALRKILSCYSWILLLQ